MIDLKRLTLVYGATNSGKSKIIQREFIGMPRALHLKLPREQLDVPFTVEQDTARWLQRVFGGQSHDFSDSGLKQALPIVEACYLVPHTPTTVLSIELPETGLDARAQQELARLLIATTAATTVLLETHSEIILLEAQLAVVCGTLLPDDVAIHWVERFEGQTYVSRVQLDATGRLQGNWPDPFAPTRALARELIALRPQGQTSAD